MSLHSSAGEGGRLSSLLRVPILLTAGYCLSSGVFRDCWAEEEAGARQGFLPDRLFVSGEEQGSAAAIAVLPNSLALHGAPGHGS